MKSIALLITLLTLSLAAAGSLASDDPERSTAQQKVSVEAINVTATVKSIDYATREVILESETGQIHSFTASDDIRNLEQVAVGDTLTVEYFSALAIAVYPVEPDAIGSVETRELSRAKPGDKPKGVITKTSESIGRVAELDRDNRYMTLEGKDVSLTIEVDDDVDLSAIKVGDMVAVKHVESTAISVTEEQATAAK